MSLTADVSTTMETGRPPRRTRGSRTEHRQSGRAAVLAIQVAIVVGIIAIWQAYGSRDAASELLIGTPQHVYAALVDLFGSSVGWQALGVTLQAAALGYLLGVGLGVALAAVVTTIGFLDRFLRPFIALFNAVPKVPLAPLLVLWFGSGITSKVYFAAMTITFVVFFGMYTGLKSIDPNVIANMRLLGASRAHLVLNVYLPATITYIMASLRFAMALSLVAVVIAEYLASSDGMGFLVQRGSIDFNTNQVMAALVAIGLVAVVVDRALARVERRFTSWRLF